MNFFDFSRRVVWVCIGLMMATPSEADNVIKAAKGPHSVGFRVVQQYDHSREFKRQFDPITGERVSSERARPIQTLIWYPARSKGSVLRYRDYLQTRLTETEFGLSPAQMQLLTTKQNAGLERRLGKAANELLNAEVTASRNAPILDQQFPVIIYAAGAGGSADENADLLEYLSSHGYLVLASTSLDAYGKEIGDTMSSVEPQVNDIQFLMAYAQTLPQADKQNLAVIGWSWGGMTSLFAASHDDRIDAVISLDGTREPSLTKQIDIKRLTSPWLYLSRSPDPITQINRSGIDTSFSLLNEAIYTDVYQLLFYPLQHHDFISRRLHESSPSSCGEYSKTEIQHAYTMAAHYIRHFLDAQLKHDKTGLAFFERSPLENGAAAHSITIERQLAQSRPATQLELARSLAQRGFQHATDHYRAAQKRDPSFQLQEQELKTWGYALMQQQRTADAIHIFTLWTVLFPNDWDAFDSLAEAYDTAGQRTQAIEHYRRSLELNPENKNAVKRINELSQ